MFPIYLTELNVIPMNGLYFTLPKSEYGCDLAIAIEYCVSDGEDKRVHCWVWAQVGDGFSRGKIDEYEVPYNPDADALDDSIICALNNSERFRAALPGYIEFVMEADSDDEE